MDLETLKANAKAHRDKADAALKKAEDVRNQMLHKEPNEWPDNAEDTFNAAMNEFRTEHGEAEKLERAIRNLEQFDAATEAYREPAPTETFQHKGKDEPEKETFENWDGPKDIYGTPQQEFRPIPEKFHKIHNQAERLYIRTGKTYLYEQLEQQLRGEHGNAEQFALVTTEGPLGGYLTTPELRRAVDVALGIFAVMRGICRVERTGSNPLVIPTVQGGSDDRFPSGYRGAWKKEGYVTGGTAPPTQDQPKFGNSSIPVHWWAPDAVEVSPITLQDAFANVEGILGEVIGETKGISEDYAFIDGSGNGIPEGLLQAGLSTVKTGDAALITYDGLVDLWTSLPPQYLANARWVFKTTTYGAILKLKDTQNRPLIDVNTTPMQLWGKPITLMEFMPEVAAGTTPIAFGDFRNYIIADRQDLRIQRLSEKYAPNIGFLPTSRLGGQVVRSRGLRLQVVQA